MSFSCQIIVSLSMHERGQVPSALCSHTALSAVSDSIFLQHASSVRITIVYHMDYGCSAAVNGSFWLWQEERWFKCGFKGIGARTLSNWLYMLIGSNWCPQGGVPVARRGRIFSLQRQNCTPESRKKRLCPFCLANHFCLQSMAEAAPALQLPSHQPPPLHPLCCSSTWGEKERKKKKGPPIFSSTQ